MSPAAPSAGAWTWVRPLDVPLKDFKFLAEFSGLPVNLTVEFYNPAKPWEVPIDGNTNFHLGIYFGRTG
jgi:hypothetical protein